LLGDTGLRNYRGAGYLYFQGQEQVNGEEETHNYAHNCLVCLGCIFCLRIDVFKQWKGFKLYAFSVSITYFHSFGFICHSQFIYKKAHDYKKYVFVVGIRRNIYVKLYNNLINFGMLGVYGG
jgi:hypothetical protein